MLCGFLPSINMDQPQVHIPPTSGPAPLLQVVTEPSWSSLSHTADSHRLSILSFLYFFDHCFPFFLPILLRFNQHTALCKFTTMVWLTYIRKQCHDKLSDRYKIKEIGKNGFFSCENTFKIYCLDNFHIYCTAVLMFLSCCTFLPQYLFIL